jgi:tRNA nucleotidyltransferase/poly(A) polymerase
VTAPEFPEIDLTTARKERYRKPGALPAVTAGRIKDDLVRRDFSINAIALDLIDGRMHDPTGGAKDIEARLVRVLHDRSFIDDPTRIFRATRLAARLGFTIEPHTAELIHAAIESGALDTVSKERIWRELFLAMDEDEAPQILSDLSARGVLEPLFGRRGNGELRARLEALREQLATNDDVDRHVLYTGALLRGDASPVDFEGSGFSQKRARALVEIANELPRVLEELAEAADDRERFRICRSVSPEMLALIAAERPEERATLQRFQDYEKFRLPLRGNDLEVPGGPHVAQALEQTREAVFTGAIPAEQARSYARAVAKRLLEQDAR